MFRFTNFYVRIIAGDDDLVIDFPFFHRWNVCCAKFGFLVLYVIHVRSTMFDIVYED